MPRQFNDTNTDHHRVIAVVTNAYSEYQKSLHKEIGHQLKTHGYGSLATTAGASTLEGLPKALLAKHKISQQCYVFNYMRSFRASGYIVLSNTLGHLQLRPCIKEFIDDFCTTPTVSAGLAIEGTDSLLLDNHAAMTAVMEYMTRDPKRQRFDYIRGMQQIPIAWPEKRHSEPTCRKRKSRWMNP